MSILYSGSLKNFAELEAIITIVLITIFTSFFSFYYWFKIKNQKIDEAPRGLVLLVGIMIENIENTLTSLLGKKYRKLTPYFFYLLLYINSGNFITVFLGLETPFSFFTVVFSLGLVSFLGIYYFGFVFEKLGFLKRYINPLELISQIASLISISFRLFGNVLAGTFIMTLIYKFLMESDLGATFKWFNFLAVFVAPLHFYFDVFSGTLHSFIFILLTMTYWSLSRPDNENRELKIFIKK